MPGWKKLLTEGDFNLDSLSDVKRGTDIPDENNYTTLMPQIGDVYIVTTDDDSLYPSIYQRIDAGRVHMLSHSDLVWQEVVNYFPTGAPQMHFDGYYVGANRIDHNQMRLIGDGGLTGVKAKFYYTDMDTGGIDVGTPYGQFRDHYYTDYITGNKTQHGRTWILGPNQNQNTETITADIDPENIELASPSSTNDYNGRDLEFKYYVKSTKHSGTNGSNAIFHINAGQMDNDGDVVGAGYVCTEDDGQGTQVEIIHHQMAWYGFLPSICWRNNVYYGYLRYNDNGESFPTNDDDIQWAITNTCQANRQNTHEMAYYKTFRDIMGHYDFWMEESPLVIDMPTYSWPLLAYPKSSWNNSNKEINYMIADGMPGNMADDFTIRTVNIENEHGFAEDYYVMYSNEIFNYATTLSFTDIDWQDNG